MRFVPLGSGSSGNATLVELGGTRLLIDAGLSARALRQRLDALGVAAASIDAVLLSHEHQDHCRGAERFSRGAGVPVVSSHATLEAMDRSPRHFAEWIPLPEAGELDLGGARIEAFPVPHDAARPVGFVVRGEGLRVGVALDMGHATTLALHRLRGCHVLMIESNYDPGMLQSGPYPWQLKQRVSSRTGHLSNLQAAALLGEVVDGECRAVVMAHLSERNNRPELVRRSAANALARAGAARASLRIAVPRRPTPEIVL